MTTPDERTRAMRLAGELLFELSYPQMTPDLPEAIRERARHILRHYPLIIDIITIAEQAERGALSGPLLDGAAARRR